jgi:hypothetical protein
LPAVHDHEPERLTGAVNAAGGSRMQDSIRTGDIQTVAQDLLETGDGDLGRYWFSHSPHVTAAGRINP